MKGYVRLMIIAIFLSFLAYLAYTLFFTEEKELSPVPESSIRIENKR